MSPSYWCRYSTCAHALLIGSKLKNNVLQRGWQARFKLTYLWLNTWALWFALEALKQAFLLAMIRAIYIFRWHRLARAFPLIDFIVLILWAFNVNTCLCMASRAWATTLSSWMLNANHLISHLWRTWCCVRLFRLLLVWENHLDHNWPCDLKIVLIVINTLDSRQDLIWMLLWRLDAIEILG